MNTLHITLFTETGTPFLEDLYISNSKLRNNKGYAVKGSNLLITNSELQGDLCLNNSIILNCSISSNNEKINFASLAPYNYIQGYSRWYNYSSLTNLIVNCKMEKEAVFPNDKFERNKKYMTLNLEKPDLERLETKIKQRGIYKPVVTDMNQVPLMEDHRGNFLREQVAGVEFETQNIAVNIDWLIPKCIGNVQINVSDYDLEIENNPFMEVPYNMQAVIPKKGWTKMSYGPITTIKDEKDNTRLRFFNIYGNTGDFSFYNEPPVFDDYIKATLKKLSQEYNIRVDLNAPKKEDLLRAAIKFEEIFGVPQAIQAIIGRRIDGSSRVFEKIRLFEAYRMGTKVANYYEKFVKDCYQPSWGKDAESFYDWIYEHKILFDDFALI